MPQESVIIICDMSDAPFRNHPFPKRLRELRDAKGLTQYQLAEISGVTQTDIVLWEGGRRLPQQGRTRAKLLAAAAHAVRRPRRPDPHRRPRLCAG
jgi:DNA-binding XRE family transcriptional regulator